MGRFPSLSIDAWSRRHDLAQGAGLERILDAVPAILWVSEATGRRFLNRTWSDLTGRPRAEGPRWLEAVHPEDRGRLLQAVADADASHGPLHCEYRVRDAHGRDHWMLDTGHPLLDESGAFSGYVGSVVDITERRELEGSLRVANERLMESQRAKALFLNAASHELRTPMTPLLMQLQLLMAMPELPPERVREGLAAALRSVDRLQHLVTDILSVARLDGGGMTLSMAPTDLRPVLDEVTQSFAASANVKGVRLELSPGPPLEAVADGRRIAQVAANLLSNALRFTPRGGQVTVKGWSEGGEVLFCVKDTGAGIPAGREDRLFKPFSVAHEAKALDSGSGLGLYICRSIVTAHGGQIQAESRGPGQGATFTVRLPVARAQGQSHPGA